MAGVLLGLGVGPGDPEIRYKKTISHDFEMTSDPKRLEILHKLHIFVVI